MANQISICISKAEYEYLLACKNELEKIRKKEGKKRDE